MRTRWDCRAAQCLHTVGRKWTPIDTRLKVAEDTAQAQSMDSMNAATNKSGIPAATGNIEALDQFMAATTDDKLLNNDDRNNDRGGINK